MEYTRQDIIEYMGRKRALSHFIKLRNANLGCFKMTYYQGRSRHSKEPIQVRASLLFFNPDEVISYFENLKQEYINNPLKTARPLYLKAWDNAIEVAKYFKEKK